MLKGISPLISPILLKHLAEMGHGDTLTLADANFPSESIGKNCAVVRADGHGIEALLQAILPLFPLDTYTEKAVTLMQVVPGDRVATPIWDSYKKIIGQHDHRGDKTIANLERFAFYDQAKLSHLIIATGEKALYANLILQKGVIA